jgi:hypothetical protein
VDKFHLPGDAVPDCQSSTRPLSVPCRQANETKAASLHSPAYSIKYGRLAWFAVQSVTVRSASRLRLMITTTIGP